MVKNCTNAYLQNTSLLTAQEVKMKLLHPKALKFEQAKVPFTSPKWWNMLSEVIVSYTQLP